MLMDQFQRFGSIEKIYIKSQDTEELALGPPEVSYGFVAFFKLEATLKCLKNK